MLNVVWLNHGWTVAGATRIFLPFYSRAIIYDRVCLETVFRQHCQLYRLVLTLILFPGLKTKPPIQLQQIGMVKKILAMSCLEYRDQLNLLGRSVTDLSR